MTTPTPAGWYPDPDGSGGQRYWDGNSWTEHRAPATQPPAPAEPQAPAQPVAPAEPDSPDQPPANEEPTAVVQLRSVPTETHVGAHRKPDSEPDPESTPSVDPAPFDIPASPSYSGPFPSAPAFGAPAAAPSNGNRRLAIGYGAACVALLLVLVGLAIYGFVIKKPSEVQLSTPGNGEITTEAPQDSGPGSWDDTPTPGTESPTAAPAPGPAGDVADGPLSFSVLGMEIGSTVVMSDAPIEKTAVGQFVVVHMTVTNTSADPTTFIAMFQTLHAGGTTYQVDDEATAYLQGTIADLPPSASQEVSIAFDVPAGTTPESIELHLDPTTPGVQVPLP